MVQSAKQVLQPKRWVVVLIMALPLLGIALGYVVDEYFWPYLMGWLRQQNAIDPAGMSYRNAIFLASLLLLPTISSIMLSCYFWLLAFRIFSTQSFPPRGYIITVRTAVLNGRAATREAVKLVIFGGLNIAFITYVIWAIFDIFPKATEILRPLYG